MRDETLFVRIPSGLKDRLKEAAERDHRTMSSEALYLIERGIEVLNDQKTAPAMAGGLEADQETSHR